MMSYTRVPYALAEEGLLPKVLTWKTTAGVPWVSVVLCSVAWALALRLSFERLISIDLVLYGAALVLEFVALVVLRVKEPGLVRPFRVPGGLWGAVAMGVGPTLLIGFALVGGAGRAGGRAAGVGVCGDCGRGGACGLSGCSRGDCRREEGRFSRRPFSVARRSARFCGERASAGGWSCCR